MLCFTFPFYSGSICPRLQSEVVCVSPLLSIPIIPCTGIVMFPLPFPNELSHIIPSLFLCELFLCLLLHDGKATLPPCIIPITPYNLDVQAWLLICS